MEEERTTQKRLPTPSEMLRDATGDGKLDEMLRKAVRPLSKAERRAQRISFTMGMLPHDSTITREFVEQLHDESY